VTNGLFDTSNEMQYILGELKPYCLIRMIPPGDGWADPSFGFSESDVSSEWLPGEPMPAGLADTISVMVRAQPDADNSSQTDSDPDDDADEPYDCGAARAAVRLQRTYRGFSTRRLMTSMRLSATKLQASFRGFETRVPRDIFVSYRLAEAKHEAATLKKALEKFRLRVFVPDFTPGSSRPHAIATNLAGCRLAVILATRTYGPRTTEVRHTTALHPRHACPLPLGPMVWQMRATELPPQPSSHLLPAATVSLIPHRTLITPLLPVAWQERATSSEMKCAAPRPARAHAAPENTLRPSTPFHASTHHLHLSHLTSAGLHTPPRIAHAHEHAQQHTCTHVQLHRRSAQALLPHQNVGAAANVRREHAARTGRHQHEQGG
jgi:hypothetical protein